jgi:hypothetical protein
MKRWLPLFSTILAVGFTAIGAHAQPVSEGFVAIYEGYIGAPSFAPYPTGLTQSTQQVSVDLIQPKYINGTTVITNYLTPPCIDPGTGRITDHSCVHMGDTSVQWSCQRAPAPKLCTLTSNPDAALGVITQFWVNPSNALKSILTPPYPDSPADEGQPYKSYIAPNPTTFPSSAISLMTCPAGNNITCIMYNAPAPVCRACLLLAYGASGFVKHFRQWREPLSTLSGSTGELIYVRQSLIKPIQTAADYNAALARIDTLMDAEPDTAEGKERDVLTDMVKFFQTGAMAK